MDKSIILYHGSENIIENPQYGLGRKNNDFGLGFYCTNDIELAKEWSCSSLNDGFANIYSIDTSDLNILNLNSKEYNILNWITILVTHRIFKIKTPLAGRAIKYLKENFYVDVDAYDIIIGYRADDSYFDFADSFLNNGININELAVALKLGKLGEQIVIKSEYAFSKLKFLGYELASNEKYYVKRKARNEEAIKNYYKLLQQNSKGLYINDIIEGNVKNSDSRIQRNEHK